MNDKIIPAEEVENRQIQPWSAPPVPARVTTGDVDEELELFSHIAQRLTEIIEKQKVYTLIRGKKYVQCEGWTTLAAFFRETPVLESITQESDGGCTAIVKLVNELTGNTVGRASAYVEKSWNPDRNARESMAQTRATSKACRLKHSKVMVLAGFAATPAEEMVVVAAQEKANSPEAAIAAINEAALKAGTELEAQMAQAAQLPPQANVPPPEMVAAAEMLADSIPGGGARVEHDIGGLPLQEPDPFPEPPANAPNLPPVPPTQSPGDWNPSQSQTKRLWAIFKGTGWSYGQLGEFLDGCGVPANDQIYVRCGLIPTKALYDQICDHMEANRQ